MTGNKLQSLYWHCTYNEAYSLESMTSFARNAKDSAGMGKLESGDLGIICMKTLKRHKCAVQKIGKQDLPSTANTMTSYSTVARNCLKRYVSRTCPPLRPQLPLHYFLFPVASPRGGGLGTCPVKIASPRCPPTASCSD